MINVYSALNKVTSLYPTGQLNYRVYGTVSPEERFWVVEIQNTKVPESLLQVEVFDDNDVPKCCVIQRINIGRKSMFKFMNQFVDALEASRFSEPMS